MIKYYFYNKNSHTKIMNNSKKMLIWKSKENSTFMVSLKKTVLAYRYIDIMVKKITKHGNLGEGYKEIVCIIFAAFV